MELFLNLLWLLMATGLLGAWRARWVYQRKRKLERPLQEWTAVGVALILLFFAVSMTDDLHADLVVFDDSSASRRGSSIELHAHRPATHCGSTLHGVGLAIVANQRLGRAPHLTGAASSLDQFVAATLRQVPLVGRAPPTSSL
jgi:hypothetical protein